jgi:inosine-uridine nucleoside N-ribohydrolase
VSAVDRRVPRVWIDTDLALGGPRGDVDDGFALAALLAAHRCGDVGILGISTVFGNTTAASSEECLRALCRQAEVAVALRRGAERRNEPSAASEAIAALEPGAELLCLGPLTNVAAACRCDPEMPRRVGLSAVGGSLSSRGFLPPLWPFEFNFFRDRASARIVLSRDWRSLTLYPLDVVRRLTVDENRLGELAQSSPVGGYLAQESARWLRRARRLFQKRGFPLWDLPAALGHAGALDGVYETRTLARGARRLLETSRSFSCLVSFDPAEAWRRFVRLISEGGSVDRGRMESRR